MDIKNKLLLLSLMVIGILGLSSCSKDDYNPDDYVTSLFTGEYGKDMMWTLEVSVNEIPVEDYGYVMFESKYLEHGDFKFVNVIPGIATKEYKNVPLTLTDQGYYFIIKDGSREPELSIAGTVDFGKMTVNITM